MIGNPDCMICRGNRVVHLPVYHPLSLDVSIQDDMLRPAYKEFPCPECQDKVTISQVQSISEFKTVPVSNDVDLREHTERGLAHACVSRLLREGFFKFEHANTTKGHIPVTLSRATMLAVPIDRADTLDRRIRENQDRVAGVALEEAAKRIENWGSYYGATTITKRDALRELADAFESTLAKEKRDEAARTLGADREAG